MQPFTATGDNAAQQQPALRQHGHRLKAALGALVFPVQRARWQAFIAGTPGLAALAQAHPSLLYKIYRPYASRHIGCAARAELLRGHYRFLWQAGARPLVEYAARRALVLAAIEGKDGAIYRLQLTAIHDSHREGDLCLRLTRDGVSLYLASFLFRPQPGGCAIQLGALQGLRSAAGAQAVKEATRALHGCRPKNLMVAALRDLGDFFGCGHLDLVSNANRIALNWHRRRHISSDYDLAWQELQALPTSDGNYRLPCSACGMPDLEQLPSKKRAEARRRGAMLLQLAADMRWQVAALLHT
ncbi:VirK/YbjX family protein [Janthinobacterium sp. LB2P10]|uniref:VirK/YbjX family protein n=1 Tax=Janthinobacterium sp. LB2P10 TaxID=3424194 RepID=UPI003F20CCB5